MESSFTPYREVGHHNRKRLWWRRFPTAADSTIQLTLDDSDTYTVHLMKFRGCDISRDMTRTFLYCDVLEGTIERETGLHLSLLLGGKP